MDKFNGQIDYNMEEIIGRIIEADKAERAGMEEARQARKDVDATIAERKKAMREKYIKQAENRVKVVEEFERKTADEEFQKSHNSNSRQICLLEDARRNKFDGWVEDIVRRVLS